jgi:RNA polymerase sigma-70 factor (ECF subfamily)
MTAPPEGRFSTTRWSMAAGLGDQDPVSAQACLLTLCLRYWYPVYAYLRRSGHAPDAAHDLTRGFFQQVLNSQSVRAGARRFGRFRQFLLAELHRFLSGDPPAPGPTAGELAAPPARELEARLSAEGARGESPEQLLCRGFALEILGAAQKQLRREAGEAGRLAMFEALERYLGAEPQPGDFECSGRALGLRPMFVALAVQRLRQRFRELVDQELAETLAGPDELQDERQALLQVLAGGRP